MNSSIWMEDPPFLLNVRLQAVSDSVTDLLCRWFEFDKKETCFNLLVKKNCSQVIVPAESSIFGCSELVLDTEKGCRRPYFCVVTLKRKGESVNTFVTLYTTSLADDRLNAPFSIPQNFKILTLANAACDSLEVCGFKFLNGPLLTWRGERYIYLLCKNTSVKFNLSQLRIKKLVKDYSTEPNQVDVSAICRSADSNLTLNVLFTSVIEAKFFFFKINCADNKLTLLGSPLPGIYAKISKDIVVLPLQSGAFKTVVSTVTNELLVFEHGCLLTRINNLVSGGAELLINDRYWLVKEGHSVKIIDQKRYTVQSSWSNISDIVIGDFPSRGTEQLLLLATNLRDGPITKFVLTDYDAVHYDTVKEVAPDLASPEVQSTLNVFCSALEKRIELSRCSLSKSRDLYQDKVNHLLSTCDNIHLMAMGTSTRPTPSNLVPFISNSDFSLPHPEPARPLPFTITDRWQLVVLGKLCIALEITWSISVPTFLTLGLAPRDKTILNVVSTSKIVKSGLQKQQNTDEVKIENRNGGNCSIVCACDPPPFWKPSVGCDLLLTWIERDDKCTARTVVCDNLTLKADEVRKLMDDESTADMTSEKVVWALSAVQDETKLSIETSLTPLASLATNLHLIGFQPHPSDELSNGSYDHQLSNHSNSYFYHPPLGALAAMRLSLKLESENKSTITVYSRDQDQLLCFIHALYGLLGDDTKILCYHDNDLGTLKGASTSIDNEISRREEPMEDSPGVDLL